MHRFVGVAVFALVGCHSSMRPTPKQIDDIHQRCQDDIDKGTFTAKRSDRVGFLPERAAPGTPVVMYGASWCKACDGAADYMTRRGIPFVKKDVEDDEAAKANMDASIAKAGLTTNGKTVLPVLDVRGTITLGFIPCVTDYAWGAS